MTDDLYESPKRYPRTLQEAFGPHTSRTVDTEKPTAPNWRAIVIEALYYLGAAALIALMATTPHWWGVLHP